MKSVAPFGIYGWIIKFYSDDVVVIQRNWKTSDRFHSRSPSNLWHGLYFDIISLIFKSETPINNGPHHPILGFGKNIISFDSKFVCKLLILIVRTRSWCNCKWIKDDLYYYLAFTGISFKDASSWWRQNLWDFNEVLSIKHVVDGHLLHVRSTNLSVSISKDSEIQL